MRSVDGDPLGERVVFLLFALETLIDDCAVSCFPRFVSRFVCVVYLCMYILLIACSMSFRACTIIRCCVLAVHLNLILHLF